MGNAIGYGWKKFTENVGPILIAMLIFMLIGGLLYLLQWLVTPDPTVVTQTSNGVTYTTATGGSLLGSIVSFIFGIIIFVWQYLVEAAIARGGLTLTEGRPLVLSELLSFQKLGKIIVAGIILSILTVIGLILCIIPGLLVIIFGSFFIYFILDQDAGIWDSITMSFSFVKEHFGEVLLLLILCFLITLAGALLCGIGLFVAIPVVAIAKTYAYKVLRGQPVAP